MSWLTENSWPLIVGCGTLGIMSAILFDAKGRMAAVGFFLLAASLWWIEGSVVTEAEVLEKDLQSMLDSFIKRDEPAIHGQISDDAPNLRQIASEGLKQVTLDSDFHIKDVRIELNETNTEAIAHLRANGQAILRSSGYGQNVATRWETQWKKESGRWKLTGVKRLDVVNGQEIGILDPQ
ncbi:MAG: hypothetical protein KDA91_08780 [Planctomycetaceae bacterium]|nr:hypothetical protein [Planctomycetaceae bacterium]